MKLFGRELQLQPNPLRLARSLAREPDFFFLWSADGRGTSYLAAQPLYAVQALDPEPELGRALPSPLQSGELGRAPRWIGVLPYEARRALERPQYRRVDVRAAPIFVEPTWWRLGAVACIGERVMVVGDDRESMDYLARRLLGAAEHSASAVRLSPLETEPVARHRERIEAALELIRAGQIYQVNLARRLDFAVEAEPIELLAALCRRTRPAYAAALKLGGLAAVSTSPELFLHCAPSGHVRTDPIKGTRPRGQDAASDVENARELDVDPKEQAELSMIIDVERNDLGRVCQLGSVRLRRRPHLKTQGLVWHRLASVVGSLRPEVTRTELLESMLPSGSVTGAPKVRAMEVIAELEAERRGLYTGAFGLLTHQGEAELAMAIRTISLREQRGHYFVGGGIVADSDPAREVEETQWKALQVAALR